MNTKCNASLGVYFQNKRMLDIFAARVMLKLYLLELFFRYLNLYMFIFFTVLKTVGMKSDTLSQSYITYL